MLRLGRGRHFGIEIGNGGVAAAGASRTFRRAFPAASDLAGIYEDVGARLDGDIERPLISILNLCIHGAGDKRYPDIPRQFSVRTEDLSAGLLHVGERPLGL